MTEWIPLLGLGLAAWWWASARTGPGSAREFGAWAYPSVLHDPADAARMCHDLGVTHIDVMVNGLDDRNWHCQPFDKLRAFARYMRGQHIAVSFTSWVRPQDDWVAGLKSLATLCREEGCGLTLDAEEPWTLPLAPLPPAVISQWSRAVIAAVDRARWCLTGIVSVDMRLVGELVRAAPYCVPQAYATVKNAGNLRATGADGSLEELAVKRYRAAGARRVTLGAAAWNLSGAYGLSALGAVEVSARAARELGCGVRFWNVHMLRASPEIARVAHQTRLGAA